jgi:hypothetical protein
MSELVVVPGVWSTRVGGESVAISASLESAGSVGSIK